MTSIKISVTPKILAYCLLLTTLASCSFLPEFIDDSGAYEDDGFLNMNELLEAGGAWDADFQPDGVDENEDYETLIARSLSSSQQITGGKFCVAVINGPYDKYDDWDVYPPYYNTTCEPLNDQTLKKMTTKGLYKANHKNICETVQKEHPRFVHHKGNSCWRQEKAIVIQAGCKRHYYT